jgi:tungstate transport system substrate-binding protein
MSKLAPILKLAPIFMILIITTFLAWGVSRPASLLTTSSGIILATTTSLYDSGLLDQLLFAFEKNAGIRVKPIAVGTGEALKLGQKGEADLLLVHAPELENQFMAYGYGLRREELMTSEFVLVGPADDPAKVKGLSFPQALSKIAQSKAFFVSRGDNSGTHFLEERVWKEVGFKPAGKWYLQTGQGMAETLFIGSEKQAYLLTDYPTYARLKPVLKLKILCRDENYLNVYSVILVKTKNNQGQREAAERLLEYLLSPEAKQIIVAFGRKNNETEGLFRVIQPNEK